MMTWLTLLFLIHNNSKPPPTTPQPIPSILLPISTPDTIFPTLVTGSSLPICFPFCTFFIISLYFPHFSAASLPPSLCGHHQSFNDLSSSTIKSQNLNTTLTCNILQFHFLFLFFSSFAAIPLLFLCYSFAVPLRFPCFPPLFLYCSLALYLLFPCCSSPAVVRIVKCESTVRCAVLVSFFVPCFQTQPPAFLHSNLMKSELLEMLPINAKHWSALYIYQRQKEHIYQALPDFMSFVFPDKWNLLLPCFNIYVLYLFMFLAFLNFNKVTGCCRCYLEILES